MVGASGIIQDTRQRVLGLHPLNRRGQTYCVHPAYQVLGPPTPGIKSGGITCCIPGESRISCDLVLKRVNLLFWLGKLPGTA